MSIAQWSLVRRLAVAMALSLLTWLAVWSLL